MTEFGGGLPQNETLSLSVNKTLFISYKFLFFMLILIAFKNTWYSDIPCTHGDLMNH